MEEQDCEKKSLKQRQEFNQNIKIMTEEQKETILNVIDKSSEILDCIKKYVLDYVNGSTYLVSEIAKSNLNYKDQQIMHAIAQLILDNKLYIVCDKNIIVKDFSTYRVGKNLLKA